MKMREIGVQEEFANICMNDSVPEGLKWRQG